MNDERLVHLSDEQWSQVEATFPQRRNQSGFGRKISNRQAFEAVFYRVQVGYPWRHLPGEYGAPHTIYMRWTR